MPRRYFAPGGSNVVFRPIYGDVSSEKFSLKQLFTVSPFAIEKVPTLNLHEVLWGPEGKGYALLSQVVILR